MKPEENVIYRTNHFITQKMIPHEAPVSGHSLQRKAIGLSSSLQRKSSIERIINSHKGEINPEEAENLNTDHTPEKGWFSVCRHGELDFQYDINLSEMLLDMFFVNSGGTDSSIIVHPGTGIFKVAMGHPCDTEFKTYEIVEE